MVDIEFTFERCNFTVFRNIVSILFEKIQIFNMQYLKFTLIFYIVCY